MTVKSHKHKGFTKSHIYSRAQTYIQKYDDDDRALLVISSWNIGRIFTYVRIEKKCWSPQMWNKSILQKTAK